ncbi:amidohydrolase [Candidatus Formimonas warabiya]|uniref:Peptidase M20 n=1 Tax=Formimonas warabiya TaxID=1761012 RepID=A0A3G1KUH0_FORW1|nr:amidohydrolase [Candidatus Formimonas warabiya]ATW26153.1 peptidase M20 [Candidatus Formimonas warabiya]
MNVKLKGLVQEIEPLLVQYRRNFHKYPEAGWTEFRTAAKITEILLELGYSVKLGADAVSKSDMLGVPPEEELKIHMNRAVKQGANPELVKEMEGGLTGIIAELNCGEGPTVALRFDMDANDIDEPKEEKHRPFREGFSSENPGVMHACGHDGHAAIGLGVARMIVKIKDLLQGKIRLIFQPGEEGVRGAKAMVARGAADGVDYILGAHIGFQATKNRQLICGTGHFLATSKLDVSFTGIPAHAGAAPEEGHNALLAAACAALNLHAISRHGKGSTRITVGTLNAGQARNVIPPHAEMKIETRGETTEINEYMVNSVRDIIAGAAKMYGVDYEIKIVGETISGESSPELITKVKDIAQGTGLFTELIDYVSFGASEDFTAFMTTVQKNGGQGTYMMIGSQLASGHHDYYFDFDEATLACSVELLLEIVVNLIGKCQEDRIINIT